MAISSPAHGCCELVLPCAWAAWSLLMKRLGWSARPLSPTSSWTRAAMRRRRTAVLRAVSRENGAKERHGQLLRSAEHAEAGRVRRARAGGQRVARGHAAAH